MAGPEECSIAIPDPESSRPPERGISTDNECEKSSLIFPAGDLLLVGSRLVRYDPAR